MKFTIKDGVLKRCSLKPGETEVVIPEGVIKIDGHAFYNCTAFKGGIGLTSIVFPNSVKEIGSDAFEGCTGLTNIVIPNSVETIGGSAFYGCTGLTSVVIPDGVKEIGSDAFKGCTSLKEIVGPEIPIADYPAENKPMALAGFFKHLELFTNAEVVDGYRKYCYQRAVVALEVIFRLDCAAALKDVFADKNKITVKNFEEKFLKPAQDANAIQCVAFLLDWKNQNISIEKEFKHMERELKKDPYNVADMKKLWKYSKNKNGTICINAYKGNETEIEIPERIGRTPVTVIEEENERDVFPHGAAITQITIPGSMKKLGYNAFSGCSGLTSVVIPDSVKEIRSDAFEGCKSLTSVFISKSVKEIGSCAFDDCTALTSIIIDENNPSYSSDEQGVLFNKEKTALIRYPIGNTATSYDIPNSVREVGHCAFRRCTGLTNIFIPNSVEKIVDWAFSYCTSLTSVVIPNSVKEIGDYAFENCKRLTSVVIANSVKEIGIQVFDKTKWFVSQPNGMIYINTTAYQYKGRCPSNVELKVGTEKINKSIFENCTALKNIVIPDSVKEIGEAAFGDCTGLKNIIIPDSVEKISGSAFVGCAGLMSVIIPKSVKTIECDAFADCAGLTSVVIPDGVEKIEYFAFEGCTSLTSIVIPESVKEIDDWAFEGCDLKNLVIHTPSGSYAEQYAKEHGIKFERT